jgi:hypothetical protein
MGGRDDHTGEWHAGMRTHVSGPAVARSRPSSVGFVRPLQAHEVHGNKWASIAKFLSNRTDNSVKK